MSYTIDKFSADCRAVLATDSSPAGVEQLRQYVERALTDEAFVATNARTLFQISGTMEEPVRDVTIQGLSLRDTR